MANQPVSNNKLVDISASFPLKDTKRHRQEKGKERCDIKMSKSEKQALRPTLDKMVDISANYPSNIRRKDE